MSEPVGTLRSPQRLYVRIWRWHFFAALIVIPFVLWQSVTGVLYLWHSEIASWTHGELLAVSPSARQVSLDQQLDEVLKHQVADTLRTIEVAEDPTRSTVFLFSDDNGLQYPAFVNPHTGEYLGHIESTHWLRGLSKGLHGGWPINPLGSYLLELGACWAIVMTLTGLFLWWPRNARGLAGVLYPRLRSGSRTLWRDLHAIVGVYFALIMLAFLFSALPWTTFWGGQVLDSIERALGQNSPNSFFFGGGGGHASHGSHEPAPSLAQPDAGAAKSLDELIASARSAGARGQIEVRLLPDRSAVNVHDVHARAPDEVWLQLDGRSGAVRTRVVWDDFPLIARLVALGIDLHEGTFFGRANQIFNTAVASALIWLSVTGFIGWYRRRPEGGLSPPLKRELRYPRALIATGVTLCVLLPLLAISLAFIVLLDRSFGRFMARAA
jgi:uncharacterized iron-regulated membrane protein